jgi:LmeA-like phospholipid-binding
VDGQRGSAAGWLLGTLLGLVVLAIGADFGLRLWTEAWLAEEAQTALRLDQRPDVDLHGFPFVVQFLDGMFDQAELEVQDLEEDGLTLERVEIRGHRIHFPRRAVFGGQPTAPVRAEEATGEVEVSDDALSRYLRANELPFPVTFVGERARFAASLDIEGNVVAGASATAEVTVEEGSLVFRAVDESGLEFSIPLPTPIDGMSYRGIEVGEGTATLTAAFNRLVFRVG